jgi:hypothetical protein
LRSGRQAGRPFAAQRCDIQIIITAPTAALIFVQVVHFVFLFLGRDFIFLVNSFLFLGNNNNPRVR